MEAVKNKRVKISKLGDRKGCYQLSEARVKELVGEWHRTGVFVSPYTKSLLSDLLNALANLGVNRPWRLLKDVLPEMQRLMSEPHKDRYKTRVRKGVTDWERFVGREARSVKGIRRPGGRVFEAAYRLQITKHPGTSFAVGHKLSQLGCALDIFFVGEFKDEGSSVIYVRLNTHSRTGLNVLVGSEGEIPPVDEGAPTMGPV